MDGSDQPRLRAMTKDKTERHVIVASAILLVIFVGLPLFVVSIAQADPVPDGAPRSRSRVPAYDPFQRGYPAGLLRRQTASYSLTVYAKRLGGRP
jgi:hypothetical protein